MRGNARPIPAVGHPYPNSPLIGTSPRGRGVEGLSNTGDGVFGNGQNGVHGQAPVAGVGVWGENNSGGCGVKGSTDSAYVLGDGGTAGVWGDNTGTGTGVKGTSAGGYGVKGSTKSADTQGADGTAGVWGDNTGTGTGVKGTSAGGDAVLGFSTAADHAGVRAINDSGGSGVWARGTPAGHFEGDAGAVGVDAQGGSNSAGVVGIGGGPDGPGVTGIGAGGPNAGPSDRVGVYGQGGLASAGVFGVGGPEGPSFFYQPGVVGIQWGVVPNPSPPFCGVYGQAVPGGAGVAGQASFEGNGVLGFAADDISSAGVSGDAHGGAGWAGYFSGRVGVSGDLTVFGHLNLVSGMKSVVVPFSDGTHRRLYCMESPENWFEDFGTGQLVNGQAQVELDPGFASVVAAEDYHVFLSEYEDSNGLYVTGRTSTGFGVRAKASPNASGTFSYRVVAKRKDIAAPRFEQVALPIAKLAGRTSDHRRRA